MPAEEQCVAPVSGERSELQLTLNRLSAPRKSSSGRQLSVTPLMHSPARGSRSQPVISLPLPSPFKVQAAATPLIHLAAPASNASASWRVLRPTAMVWAAKDEGDFEDSLAIKGRDDIVLGIEEGDWLRLTKERGYMLIRTGCTIYLENVRESRLPGGEGAQPASLRQRFASGAPSLPTQPFTTLAAKIVAQRRSPPRKRPQAESLTPPPRKRHSTRQQKQNSSEPDSTAQACESAPPELSGAASQQSPTALASTLDRDAQSSSTLASALAAAVAPGAGTQAVALLAVEVAKAESLGVEAVLRKAAQKTLRTLQRRADGEEASDLVAAPSSSSVVRKPGKSLKTSSSCP